MIEKYGVDEKVESDKKATEQPPQEELRKCPVCGAELLSYTNVSVCPVCGTKPFE